jgi:sterol desaturase/sphingolipid hydroxylase (fatty acid hydroxylase superfamily)
METYAKVLAYAIPAFMLLILIESLVAYRRGVQVNRPADIISSLSSGMTNTLKTLMGLAVVILSYEWMVTHWAVFEWEASWWLYVLAFIGLDFKGYWSHRWNHKVNLLWNRHIIHHSSEEFNLSCALRQNISAIVGIYFFLYIPLAILGVPTQVVAVVAPIHFFSQFWYHTRLIDKMGILEYIIVTPSHHRVHHAINTVYLDKNFSEIFIIWDKLFGTFQEELPDEVPVYGTKRPANTWNPVLINYMHLWTLMKDAWYTRSWKDKLRIWFMPTGWRPADVEARYPIAYYREASEQEKYDSHPSRALELWSGFQLLVSFVFMYDLMFRIADLSIAQILFYGGFVMLCVFTYTSLLDRERLTLWFEGLKISYAAIWLLVVDSGFFTGIVLVVVLVYLILSLAMTFYFVKREGVSSYQLS